MPQASPRAACACCRPAPPPTSPVAILPSPASLARSKPDAIVTLSILESLGAISTMALPSRFGQAQLVDVLLSRGIIHPVNVGSADRKAIGRRALLDLLGERGACGIARAATAGAGLGGIGGIDIIERILHRRGCEDAVRLLHVLRQCGRPDPDPNRMAKPRKILAGRSMTRRCIRALRTDSWRMVRTNPALKMAYRVRQADAPFHRTRKAYGRPGHRGKTTSRLYRRVKASLVYSAGRIATDIEFSLVPLIWSTKGLAEISYFMVLRMPSQSVAPLKPFGFRACPSCTRSIHAPVDRLTV